jgi:hypothetical protein
MVAEAPGRPLVMMLSEGQMNDQKGAITLAAIFTFWLQERVPTLLPSRA